MCAKLFMVNPFNNWKIIFIITEDGVIYIKKNYRRTLLGFQG